MPLDFKRIEACFLLNSIDLLLIQLAQMYRSPDFATFVFTTINDNDNNNDNNTTDYFTPCTCVRGNYSSTTNAVQNVVVLMVVGGRSSVVRILVSPVSDLQWVHISMISQFFSIYHRVPVSVCIQHLTNYLMHVHCTSLPVPLLQYLCTFKIFWGEH